MGQVLTFLKIAGPRNWKLLPVLGMALVLTVAMDTTATAQTPPVAQAPAHIPAAPGNSAVRGGQIHGVIRAGTIPLSGVRVTATDPQSQEKYATLTDGTGNYAIAVPDDGRYTIRATFRALTSSPKLAVLGAENRAQEVDFTFQASAATNNIASLWPALVLAPVIANTLSLQPASIVTGGIAGAQFPTFFGDPDFSGDTFIVIGQALILTPYFQMADQMRQDFEDGHQLQGPSMLYAAGAIAEMTTLGAAGTIGGTAAPSGASAMGISAPGASAIGHTHGEFYWNGGNSALNAEPFLLAGQPAPNPSYNSNGYGATIGTQPFFPGLTKPSPRDYVLLSFAGQLGKSLVNDYGIVPTDLEREGNFSQLTGPTGQLIPIYPPKSIVPYPNNTINTPLDPVASALLPYFPKPNLDSTGLNYRLLTVQGTHSDTVGLSYTHSFGKLPNPASPSTGQVLGIGQDLTQTLNVNFNWGGAATDVVNIFPGLGGKQRTQGYALTAGYTAVKGAWITSVSVTSTRNNAQVKNPYTGGEDIASQLGIYADIFNNPVNTNPLNYGLPDLVFNNFTGFTETQPNFQLTQTLGVSGNSSWTRGAHIVRFGGDVHGIQFNLFGGTDATGAFIFSGGYTQIETGSTNNPVAATGSSFADFLIGFPQEAKLESPDQKAYARQTNWDLFIRDDWRIRPNLTLCVGLRYDYFGPFVEKYNRLSTLDYNSDFSVIAPVQPDGIGPISGAQYPRGLVKPDRTNFSPHVGLAWQASPATVLRAGYGINYTVAEYGSFIQNLAYQPPFADVQANGNVPHFFSPFTLEAGFGNLDDFGNYAIDRNYRLPYVQTWFLDVQRELPFNLMLDVGYTGSKGSRLDVISAPGAINSLPFANAYFDFEDSTAFSKFNALVVRANRRFQNGLALQAIYSYSHSIDDASSTNAGVPVVAQNWQDILAEESNSSFDIRHQVTGSVVYQLPFGANKPFLNASGWASRAFGGWSLAGSFTLATGMPLTPYVSASVAEVERGTHGSVRPDRVPGVSVTRGGGHLQHWFNTAAFSPDFAPDQLYGDASRYSIPGPGVQCVNLSFSKIIPMKEARSLELRATGANAFNIVQYSGVNTQISSSTFGYVDAVQPMRQLTFLARFRF